VSGEDKFDRNKFGDDLGDRIRDQVNFQIREGISGRTARGGRRGGMLPGIILILVGTVILLDHMGVLRSVQLWRFWPVILILVGAVRFAESCNRAFGVVLMLVGTLLLLGNLGYVRLSWAEIWPIAIIALGVSLIWTRFEMPKLPPVSAGGPNTVNEFAMFAGVERRIAVSNFAGGSVSAIFGGVELDFRSADIEGEEAVLIVEATFGGIEITVPDRWIAIFEGQSLFGGYSDETRPPLPDVPGAPPRKRLILRGRALFGGINVKS
jgi:predicted membrane protein